MKKSHQYSFYLILLQKTYTGNTDYNDNVLFLVYVLKNICMCSCFLIFIQVSFGFYSCRLQLPTCLMFHICTQMYCKCFDSKSVPFLFHSLLYFFNIYIFFFFFFCFIELWHQRVEEHKSSAATANLIKYYKLLSPFNRIANDYIVYVSLHFY